jgi:hypothetical protein
VTAVLPLLARDIADKESGLRVANDRITGTGHNEAAALAPPTHGTGAIPSHWSGTAYVSCTAG